MNIIRDSPFQNRTCFLADADGCLFKWFYGDSSTAIGGFEADNIIVVTIRILRKGKVIRLNLGEVTLVT